MLLRINLLSDSLKHDFPDATGFSPRNLSRMKKFYEEYRDLSNLPPAVANLPWTHNYLLLEKVKDADKRIWYAEKALENSWSKVVLDHQIDLQLEWALKPVNAPIGVASYEIKQYLPSEEELNKWLE